MAANGPDPQPYSRTAAVALLAAFLFVLPFSSSAALRNALLALAAAFALYRAAQGDGAPFRLPPWRVLVPLAAYSAWSVASVAWSVDPAYSASELRPGLLYPVIAFLAFHAVTADAADLDRWAWSLAAGLAALGLLAAGQLVLTGWWDPERWHGDAGFYATHLMLALPLVAWAFLRAGPAARGARVAFAGIALLALVVASWNDNRVIWVVLAAMTLLAVLLLRDELAGGRRAALHAVAALALVAFAGLFALSVEQRTERLAGTAHAAEAQLERDPRLAIWDYAARRHGEAPWAGHGYGRAILGLQFRTGVKHGIDDRNYTHAHSTPLNVLLQGGVVGLGLFAWMVAALAREMAAGLASTPARRHVAALGLVLLAGFALRNLTDDFLVRHNALLAWSLAGAVLGALRPTCARRPG